MNSSSDTDRIAAIRKRLSENSYFLNPHSDANAREDLSFLLSLMEQKDLLIAKLEKKGTVLSQQVLELTQEMENIRSDFDSHR
jgi:hypothetical protein